MHEVNMKQAELKKVVKFVVSDTVCVYELKAVREFVKLVKSDVVRVLNATCAILKEEGIKRRFYISEYVDADITFYDEFGAVVMAKTYGYDNDDKLHEYVIYTTVNRDLSMRDTALVSVDGTDYCIGQYSL